VRGTIAIVVAGVLALLAFETGVHSTHHLASGHAGPPCAVAVATGHLAGVPVDTATVYRVVLASGDITPVDRVQIPAMPQLYVDRSRAPPVST
jgi:hypothetical protein